tara:strand:- start:59 stop:187 length:129 start_codon:yes stop_codon:yes gene_type:complete
MQDITLLFKPSEIMSDLLQVRHPEKRYHAGTRKARLAFPDAT